MLCFEFRNREFVEVSGTPSSDIYLLVNRESESLELHFSTGANLIECRTAERQARSIAASGVQLVTGERIGRGFNLTVNSDGTGLPERLKKPVPEAYFQKMY
ncbi:MAG: hypothetical protein ACE5R6_16955 [Candidatus Heimdallarchaeota archaeon]